MQSIRLPGPLWVLLASGVCSGVLAVLQGEVFAAELYTPIAIAALMAILKWLSQQGAPAEQPTRQVGSSAGSALVRFWLG